MNKAVRITILLFVFSFLIYNYYSRFIKRNRPFIRNGVYSSKDIKIKLSPLQVSFIFDGLGSSINDLREIYSLDIPVSVAIIPGLRFSKNIAYIAKRCGFSVLINLPLGRETIKQFPTGKYPLINSSLNRYQLKRVLRYYLNSIRIANGVVLSGKLKAEDVSLMKIILEEIKRRDLIFIDNTESSDISAFKLAQEAGIKTGHSACFIDFKSERSKIKEDIHNIMKAKDKGRVIVVVRTDDEVLKVIKEELPILKKEVSLITLDEYFEAQHR